VLHWMVIAAVYWRLLTVIFIEKKQDEKGQGKMFYTHSKQMAKYSDIII